MLTSCSSTESVVQQLYVHVNNKIKQLYNCSIVQLTLEWIDWGNLHIICLPEKDKSSRNKSGVQTNYVPKFFG